MIEPDKWSHFAIQNGENSFAVEKEAKYRLSFEWGAVHVSEKADKAYGLVPLTADVIRDAEDDTHVENAWGMRTDVYLLSPEEFNQDISKTKIVSRPYRTASGVGATIFANDGIKLFLALHDGQEGTESRLLNDLESYVNYYYLCEDMEDAQTPDDIPIKGSDEQEITQLLVHDFCDLVDEATRESITEYFRAERSKFAAARLARLGSKALIGAGIAIGTVGTLHNGIEMIIPDAAIVYAAVQSQLAYAYIKKHMRQANSLEFELKNTASNYGNVVGYDIHQAYCATHFNMKAEKKFKDS